MSFARSNVSSGLFGSCLHSADLLHFFHIPNQDIRMARCLIGNSERGTSLKFRGLRREFPEGTVIHKNITHIEIYFANYFWWQVTVTIT